LLVTGVTCPSDSHRILFVEDEKVLCRIAVWHLTDAGFCVVPACDGTEAVAILQKEEQAGRYFDLLVTDLQMPEMNGFELLDWVAQSRHIALPVLVITGFSDVDTLKLLINYRVNGLLEKPFTPDKLLEKVKAVLADHEREHEKSVRELVELFEESVECAVANNR